MSSVVLNVSLILLLVVIQGVFVAAELALVSLRESQVRQLAHRGKRGQLVAKLTSESQPVPLRGSSRCHALRLPCRRFRRRQAVR